MPIVTELTFAAIETAAGEPLLCTPLPTGIDPPESIIVEFWVSAARRSYPRIAQRTDETRGDRPGAPQIVYRTAEAFGAGFVMAMRCPMCSRDTQAKFPHSCLACSTRACPEAPGVSVYEGTSLNPTG